MEQDNLYKDFSEKVIEDAITQIFLGKIESGNKRKFKMGTGKLGVIDYLNAVHKDFNTEEELIELNTKWKEQLPEGIYYISEEEIKYYKI